MSERSQILRSPFFQYADTPDRLTQRKLRLFGVALCRLVSAQFPHPRCHESVGIAERFADGRATSDQRGSARFEIEDVLQIYGPRTDGRSFDLQFNAAYAATDVCKQDAFDAATDVMDHVRRNVPELARRPIADYGLQRHLFLADMFHPFIRDVFGDSSAVPAFDPRWRTADCVGLALGIYDDRAFDRLPILADALIEAGCDDEQILAHCRSDGPHVRGCWVVDLVLGKE
jgi:hypothetical protein